MVARVSVSLTLASTSAVKSSPSTAAMVSASLSSSGSRSMRAPITPSTRAGTAPQSRSSPCTHLPSSSCTQHAAVLQGAQQLDGEQGMAVGVREQGLPKPSSESIRLAVENRVDKSPIVGLAHGDHDARRAPVGARPPPAPAGEARRRARAPPPRAGSCRRPSCGCRRAPARSGTASPPSRRRPSGGPRARSAAVALRRLLSPLASTA